MSLFICVGPWPLPGFFLPKSPFQASVDLRGCPYKLWYKFVCYFLYAELERYMTCAKEAAQQVLQDDELRNDPKLMQKVLVQYHSIPLQMVFT